MVTFRKKNQFVREHIPIKIQNSGITSKLMLDYILSKNPDISIVDSSGYTPLRLAAYYKDGEMAATLRNSDTLNQEEEIYEANSDKNLRYKFIERPDVSERIKNAAVFKIRPIDFSGVQFNEIGFSSKADWNNEKAGVTRTYADACLKLLEQSSVENKTIIITQKDEIINDGIIIEVFVKKIILNWNYYDKRPDQYLCHVVFSDSRNGEKLFSAKAYVSSRGLHGVVLSSGSYPGAGPTFRVNPGDPGWEGTFSGRLHIAADNMAWMITRIITKGKIDES